MHARLRNNPFSTLSCLCCFLNKYDIDKKYDVILIVKDANAVIQLIRTPSGVWDHYYTLTSGYISKIKYANIVFRTEIVNDFLAIYNRYGLIEKEFKGPRSLPVATAASAIQVLHYPYTTADVLQYPAIGRTILRDKLFYSNEIEVKDQITIEMYSATDSSPPDVVIPTTLTRRLYEYPFTKLPIRDLVTRLHVDYLFKGVILIHDGLLEIVSAKPTDVFDGSLVLQKPKDIVFISNI